MGNQMFTEFHSDEGNGLWFWQSNSQPWSQDVKQEWTQYTPERNIEIEKAYLKRQKTYQYDIYIIDFSKMLQINKENKYKQRRVKRVTDKDQAIRGNRYYGNIKKKTNHNAFGELLDFLNIIKVNIQESQQQDIFNLAFEEIQHNAPQIEKVSKRDQKTIRKIYKYLNSALSDRKTRYSILESEEDLRAVNALLKAYTEQSFIFNKLNESLRNENWDDIDKWKHYIYILIKYFLEYSKREYRDNFKDDKLVLYRGTRLPKEQAIKDYDIKTQPYFSWMSFVSTSKEQKIAKKFSTYTGDENSFPINFTIVVDFKQSSAKLRQNIINLSKASIYPDEKEYLIAPGSIFQIIESELKEHSLDLTLKLITLDMIESEISLHKDSIVCDKYSKMIKLNDLLEINDDINTKVLKRLTNELEENQTLKILKINSTGQYYDEHLVYFLDMLRTTKISELYIKHIKLLNKAVVIPGLVSTIFINTNLKIIDLDEYINCDFDQIIDLWFKYHSRDTSLLSVTLEKCHNVSIKSLHLLEQNLINNRSVLKFRIGVFNTLDPNFDRQEFINRASKELKYFEYQKCLYKNMDGFDIYVYEPNKINYNK